MCADGKPSGKLQVKGVEYDACDKCGKPIRGTGKKIGGVAIFVTKDFREER